MSNSTFSASILEVDKPTINNRIYSREVVCEALENLGDDVILGYLVGDDAFSLQEPIIKIDTIELKDNSVVISATPLDNPKGKMMKELLTKHGPDSIVIRTTGVGNVDEQSGHVTYYKLQGALVCLKGEEL
ncbi:MAG: hypothetical protein KY428_07635 [Bacteroidetes bacterium]|nr:hypothetical protein [Bacteroidota bacterium]